MGESDIRLEESLTRPGISWVTLRNLARQTGDTDDTNVSVKLGAGETTGSSLLGRRGDQKYGWEERLTINIRGRAVR